MSVLREALSDVAQRHGRTWCSRRCRVSATWPCLPAPPGWRPRRHLELEPEKIPVVWPAVPPRPVSIAIVRRCVDCDAELPEPTKAGRPPSRCAACRNPAPVASWERPAFMPSGEEVFDPWLAQQLQVAALPWEPPPEDR